MIHPELRVIEESLRTSSRGGITGVIFFEFGSFKFPEATWSDFVVVLLNDWLRALRNLMIEKLSVVELSFMDGPFSLEVYQDSAGQCTIKCINGRTGDVQYECKSDAHSLLRSVVVAAVRTHRTCKEQRWVSMDIETLEQQIASAKLLMGLH